MNKVNDLQEELKRAWAEIELLRKNQIPADEVEEVLLLRDQIIKLNMEKFQLKELLNKAADHNPKFEKELDQFFEVFNIPKGIKRTAKLNLILDQFLEQRKKNADLQNKLHTLKEVESQLNESNNLVTKLEYKNVSLQRQNEKLQIDNRNLLNLLEKLQAELGEIKNYWDVEIKCQSLKAVLSSGWELVVNRQAKNVDSQIFYFSEQLQLLNLQLEGLKCQRPIANSNVHVKQIGSTLYYFKVVSCTNQPIQYIGKQEEALDEFWMMYALMQQSIINIIARPYDYTLWNKINHIKTTLNSSSTIILNGESIKPFQQQVDPQIHKTIDLFTQQAFPWFFQYEAPPRSETTAQLIKFSCLAKVKPDRATTKLHFLGDYYQQTEKLYLYIQKPLRFQEAVAKKYQLNTGILVRVKLKTDSIIKKTAQIMNYFTQSDELQVSSDENYVYITV